MLPFTVSDPLGAALVGLVSAFVGGLLTLATVAVRGWNKRKQMGVGSNAQLAMQQFELLRQTIEQIELRADKQATAHRDEIERLDKRNEERAQMRRDAIASVQGQLDEVRSQLTECLAEKREANHKINSLEYENRLLAGKIAVLDQSTLQLSQRMTEQEQTTAIVKKQTDKLLPK